MSGNPTISTKARPEKKRKDNKTCIYDEEAKQLVDYMFSHLANRFYATAKEIKPKKKIYVDKEHMITAMNILLPEDCCRDILEYHDSKAQLSS